MKEALPDHSYHMAFQVCLAWFHALSGSGTFPFLALTLPQRSSALGKTLRTTLWPPFFVVLQIIKVGIIRCSSIIMGGDAAWFSPWPKTLYVEVWQEDLHVALQSWTLSRHVLCICPSIMFTSVFPLIALQTAPSLPCSGGPSPPASCPLPALSRPCQRLLACICRRFLLDAASKIHLLMPGLH